MASSETKHDARGDISEQYEKLFSSTIESVNEHLSKYLDKQAYDTFPEAVGLWDAMRYGTLNGGKRIRSVLAIESCLAFGGRLESIMPAACAIELVHSQSLMHDDLPCMDNDDMRRGQPSVHKAYGESTAVLAGDALIALAFGVISKQTPVKAPVTAETLVAVLSDFSDVTSIRGLVNGQYVDILCEGREFSSETLEYIHTYKTGALFRFALRSGARLAGTNETMADKFTELGQKLGLAFQIMDDLLDIDSTSEALGKTAGKDQLQEKATYPAFYGVEESRRKVKALSGEVHQMLDAVTAQHPGFDASRLKALVDFIATRIH